uniref:Uncharacterized protein n=1 Tax=Anopheles atroparvus TaxID=41427 RepID=A0AAG5DHK5_ANOAO
MNLVQLCFAWSSHLVNQRRICQKTVVLAKKIAEFAHSSVRWTKQQ